jgi:tetratricopeptide (TPR) repeat protein
LRLYWVPAATVAVVIASLAIGLYVANRERAIAQQRFSEVRQLAHTFVFDVYDDVARLQGSTKTREMMVRTGLQYLARLGESAGSDRGLQKEIADAYVKIGDAQGSPTVPNLGRTSDALDSYRKALEIYQRIAARDAAYLPDLATHYSNYGNLMRLTDHLKQARELSHSAIGTFDRLRSTQRFDENTEASYIKAWCTEGDIDETLSRYQQAWTEFSRCSELAKAQAAQHPETERLYLANQAAERKATAAQELGDLNGALQSLNEDESSLRDLLAREPRNPRFRRAEALLYQFRSIVFFDDSKPSLDDPARALENAKLYLSATEEMVRRDPNDRSAQRSRAIAMYRVSLTLSYFEPQAAIKMARESVRVFDQFIASGKDDSLTISFRSTALQRLARAQLSAGRIMEARNSAESALTAERSLAADAGPDGDEIEDLIMALVLDGKANAAAGGFERAESLLREAHEKAQGFVKPLELMSHIPLASSEQALGDFYRTRRRTGEARACYQELVALWQKLGKPNEYVARQRSAAEKLLVSVQ